MERFGDHGKTTSLRMDAGVGETQMVANSDTNRILEAETLVKLSYPSR